MLGHTLRNALLAAGGLTFTVLAGAAGAQSAKTPIRIGALQSVTGSDAINGFNNLFGLRMATEEINKSAGIAGRPIELVLADDQSEPSAAVNEARRLIFQEKVAFVMGPTSSQRTIAAIPVFNEAKILNVSTSGSNQLTPTFAPYHFSMNPAAEAQAMLMAQYAVKNLKAKSVGILTDDGAQAKSGVIDIKRALDQAGVKVVGEQQFQFRSEDKTPQLLSLRRAGADALIIWANTPEDYAGVMNGLEQIGWDKVPISGAVSQSMLAPPAGRIAEPGLFKTVGAVSYKGWTYCPGEDVSALPYVKFNEALRRFDPKRYPELTPTQSGWSYDGLFLVKAAVEATGATDGPTLAAWIEQNAGSVPFVSGKPSASKTNHFLIGMDGMTMIRGPLEFGPERMLRRADC